jgi:hypothetical protein
MTKTRLAFLISVLTLLGSAQAWAQANAKESVPTSPVISLEEREKAKKRLYPGGRDEESLQVQAQLANPGRGGKAAEPEEVQTDHD